MRILLIQKEATLRLWILRLEKIIKNHNLNLIIVTALDIDETEKKLDRWLGYDLVLSAYKFDFKTYFPIPKIKKICKKNNCPFYITEPKADEDWLTLNSQPSKILRILMTSARN